ncbi:uncharacterized protein [Physcomitrium patens]|uniref:Uncharacterized protein n=1 Tax=Physcomitrium patens TaxID=3218 RepID=A0A2K1IDY4_PHYPA|nr:uncharacterized protein LOC112277105 [Physcomitrium patens]XP_024364839.1 uncharacterized protein LOC112277105 [Physcomitrium patens]XP_024364840.1 uncharacterized protein LOC112277105 [Physcomitrium patens]PNR27480.1 hypothetical protein PHYPA_029632 [Physcomitrium patens]|eukprot:XP_024364837.1 uncharacterized protein LOC112277105 [Physcomitrella patens]
MAGREVKDFTNLSDPKDKKWGKGGKDKADDEDLAFKRMVAKMQEVAGERGGYLHGRGALDSDDLLYLKEQMEAEEDAERLRRRTEKRAFAAFKKAASLVDNAAVPTLPAIRVEPKPRSGIRQQVLVKSIVKVKAERPRSSDPSVTVGSVKSNTSSQDSNVQSTGNSNSPPEEILTADTTKTPGGLLGLAYESEEDSDEEPVSILAVKRPRNQRDE